MQDYHMEHTHLMQLINNMDNRKRILLGNTDIKSRTIQDFYVDINLSKNEREIIPYKYDNIFDLTSFYNKERNESRNFIIYGTVNSYLCDCNNLIINVYDSTGSTANLITTASTTTASSYAMQFYNIYGFKKGKYIINNIPNNFTGYSIYLKIDSNNQKLKSILNHNIFEQQLIFTTLTMSNTNERVVEKLNYGLNETIVDCDGNVFQVNNDFDFFYNKHWIQKDLDILNLQTHWVGIEAQCEMTGTTHFKERVINGNFRTGNYIYGSLQELYDADNSPTGNIKTNIFGDADYIAPRSSSGNCTTASTYSLQTSYITIPAAGNVGITSTFPNKYLTVNPNDNIFLETENITITNIVNDLNWNFLNFSLNGQQINSNSFNFNISQNSNVIANYQEVFPYSLTINQIPATLCGTAVASSNVYSINPQNTKFSNGQNVTINVFPESGYYMEAFYYTNSTKTNEYILPTLSKSVVLTIDSDTTAQVVYAKFLTLTVMSDLSTYQELTFDAGTIQGNGALGGLKCNQIVTFKSFIDSSYQGVYFEYVIYDDNGNAQYLQLDSEIIMNKNKIIKVIKIEQGN